MKAVILAGGKGTRMGNMTRETPKPMLQIGDEPLLGHQVNLLKKYGINDILILVNYLKDPIIEHFEDGKKYDVNISYYEELEPMGTVGGIKEVEDQLIDDFIVLYGDVMINMDLQRLVHFHKKNNSDCTLVLHPNDHPHDSDLVQMNDSGRVTHFYPKPHTTDRYFPNMVNAGAYVFSPKILSLLEKGKKADFGREIFPRIYSKINMFGYNTAEYLKDMGTPKRLMQVEQDFQYGKIKRAGYDYKQKAVFLDRDGVINEEISFISRPEDMVLYPFTIKAIQTINKSEFKSIVITNQSVIARNMCTLEELKYIHNKMETQLGKEGAKLDAIYYCPHHPDKGFPEERTEYKMDCLCRKPKAGMLLDAAFDFNIDLENSYMIGDNERDIQAGRNAGCITIGVRTGYGIKKASAFPDYMFANLLEAVNFITTNPYADLRDKLNKIILTTPSIILIGGKAQSGKSTLASNLELNWIQRNKKILRIDLDNWILPEPSREPSMNIYERFQLSSIETDIQKILSGISVKLNTYSNHPERKPLEVEYKYTGQDIVLIEGVVALSSEIIRELSSFKIFMEIEASHHHTRIKEYYKWKGKNKDEIATLYEQRLKDEYLLIEKECKFADLVVNTI